MRSSPILEIMFGRVSSQSLIRTESTVRKTLFIAARPDGLKNLTVFDSELLEYREIDQKYVFTIVTTPLMLKGQDLKVHLMSSKEEKIAAVQLDENQEGKSPGSPKKNSFESQSIGGPVWGWIIAIMKIFLPIPPDHLPSLIPEQP